MGAGGGGGEGFRQQRQSVGGGGVRVCTTMTALYTEELLVSRDGVQEVDLLLRMA